MAAAVENPRERPRLVLAVGVLTAAFVATRLALMWRFPWFVDETTFATYARDVHDDLGKFFIAGEIDKKGLLPSWLGATLIGGGLAPVTAMRLLAAAGAALAAVCGGLVVRRFYGVREGLVTAGLIALGPFFFVTASVGIYDSLVAGLATAAVLVSIRLAQRPRLATAILLGGVLGAGGLTKPTAWVGAAVLPFTLLLFDYASPQLRRRLLVWAGSAMLALAVGYAIASVARLSPLYDRPIAVENHRGLTQIFDDFGTTVSANGRDLAIALLGYLTPPGVLLVAVGAVAAWRRQRRAAAILSAWALAALASAVLLPLWGNPRYVAAAIVPLAGFVAVGGLALWDYILGTWRQRASFARTAACAVVLLALLPAAFFDSRVLTDPAHASYPGLDENQYVLRPSGLAPLGAIVREIERGGGPYPVQIDAGPYPRRIDVGPWGLDLRLNGTDVGREARFKVFSGGTPAQLAAARYIVSDGARSDAPPRPGFRLIRSAARDGGAVMRLYERIRRPTQDTSRGSP
jgi:hypothetical protein